MDMMDMVGVKMKIDRFGYTVEDLESGHTYFYMVTINL